MYLLALETAFGKFSLALFRSPVIGHGSPETQDPSPIDIYLCEKENEQAELLIPAIEEILKRNKITYADLSIIAVGTGPGSFTGVRIGLATAKGIALATGAKLIGVSSLEASAQKQNGGKIHINAQRGQAYFQEFDKNLKPLNEPELITYSGEYSPLPDATSIAHIAANREPRTANCEPIYVRKPDAKFRLRDITEKDIPWLVETDATCFTHTWNEAMFKNTKGIIADRLGFMIYEIIGDESEIKTIAVLPNARRHGVASFMFQYFLKTCEAKNVAKIFLEVEFDNVAALKFYEQSGFKVVGIRENYYGENRHALQMQLAIAG